MKMVWSVILAVISVASFVFGFFQFKEKGYLLNNSYIYASKKQREEMNKAPFYRQSAVAFFGIGFLFSIITIETLVNTGWLRYVTLGVLILIVVYAVVSSGFINKKYH